MKLCTNESPRGRARTGFGRQLTLLSSENAPARRALAVFRVFAIAAIVAALGQVTLGGVVRVTDSGMGCGDDWPRCNGELIPPLDDPATLIEYLHRLSATVLGAFVALAALAALLRRRVAPFAFQTALAAVGLVLAAALLGAFTVWTELAWWFVLLHLTIAELLIAALAASAIAGWRARETDIRRRFADADETARRLLVGAVAGVLLIILSGSFMVGYGAGTSCATWPLCRGDALPDGAAYLIHMAHRYVAALVGLVVLAACWRAWAVSEDGSPVRAAAFAVVTAFAVQIGVGAVVVWSGFDNEIKAIHLSLATAVWIALIAILALYFTTPTREDAGASAAPSRARTPAEERQWQR